MSSSVLGVELWSGAGAGAGAGAAGLLVVDQSASSGRCCGGASQRSIADVTVMLGEGTDLGYFFGNEMVSDLVGEMVASTLEIGMGLQRQKSLKHPSRFTTATNSRSVYFQALPNYSFCYSDRLYKFLVGSS